MGYYTYYDLTVIDAKTNNAIIDRRDHFETRHAMAQYLVEHSEWFNGDKVEDNDTIEDIIGYDSMKWYDFDKDMLAVSKAFPDYHFILDGDGEEFDDIWRCYFSNGAMQMEHAEIVYGDCQLW